MFNSGNGEVKCCRTAEKCGGFTHFSSFAGRNPEKQVLYFTRRRDIIIITPPGLAAKKRALDASAGRKRVPESRAASCGAVDVCKGRIRWNAEE